MAVGVGVDDRGWTRVRTQTVVRRATWVTPRDYARRERPNGRDAIMLATIVSNIWLVEPANQPAPTHADGRSDRCTKASSKQML